MPYLVIKDFKGGVDLRRLTEMTPPGALRECVNAHITSGGEIEKRKAFVGIGTLPAGTFGLFAVEVDQLYVFGSIPAPAGLPFGVIYQQLVGPTGNCIAVTDADLFAGKLYVVAKYDTGITHHFYDGQEVIDFFDGRAAVVYTLRGGTDTAATAEAWVQIEGGTTGSGNTIEVRFEGVSLNGTPTAYNTDNDTTALNLTTAINGRTGTTNMQATQQGARVLIKPTTAGDQFNGRSIEVTTAGDFQYSAQLLFEGGESPTKIQRIDVDGIDVLATAIAWRQSDEVFAADLAKQINIAVTTPNYMASSNGKQLTIKAVLEGEDANGRRCEITFDGTLTVEPSTTQNFFGGIDPASVGANPGTYTPTPPESVGGDGIPSWPPVENYQPTATSGFPRGEIAQPFKSKIYSPAITSLYFSMVEDPTRWSVGNTGAGFIDMSTQMRGRRQLIGLTEYYDNLAVFADRSILIWFMEDDPALNQLIQTLQNTGTVAPNSITQFGDSDVFYLDFSGIRSLKARDSSNAAFTQDIGSPIDPLVRDLMATSQQDIVDAYGIMEPRDGRFWLAIGTSVLSFSFYPANKVSAWGIYEPGFKVDVFSEVRDALFVRSGDSLYRYGGADGAQYDNTAVRITLPFLDADSPGTHKTLQGIDLAVLGEWTVEMAYDPTQPDLYEEVGIVTSTTYAMRRIPVSGYTTHFAPRLTHNGDGPAKIGGMAIHYLSGESG